MNDMDPQRSTIDRGHVNILCWPVFGGIVGWAALDDGINIQVGAPTEEEFRDRVKYGMNEIWDHIDKLREDNVEFFQRVWRYRQTPVMLVSLPAAPPFLRDGVLEAHIDHAYDNH